MSTDYKSLLLGNVGGSLGETSALLIIIGGLYLIYKGYVDWRIPASYLGSVAILSAILGQDLFFICCQVDLPGHFYGYRYGDNTLKQVGK